MGLLDNFNLDDPKTQGLLQAGMAILANNGRGMNGGQAIGTGLLQGLGGMQQAQQLQQQKMLKDRELQLQQQNMGINYQRLGMENDKLLADQKKQQEIDDAIAEQAKLHPELAGAFRLDPKTALKVAFPQLSANSADPYYTPIATDNGMVAFDNRTGKFTQLNLNGKPLIKSTDSPTLQGQIAAYKSYGQNQYSPTDMQDGVIKTKSQLAVDAGAPQIGTPQSFPTVSRQEQVNRDGKRVEILKNELASENNLLFTSKTQEERDAHKNNIELIKKELGSSLPKIGIQVPTKAEQAASIESAKLGVTTGNNLQVEKDKNIRSADKFLSVANQAKDLLSQDPTASGFGALVDKAGHAVGITSKSSQIASQLDAVSGWLTANVPRMEGPQSNFDVENYKTMAGKVGDRTIPVKERQAALDAVIRLQQKYKDLNGGAPAQQPAKIRKYNPKTGKIE